MINLNSNLNYDVRTSTHLTGIVHNNGVESMHEDFWSVLIHGSLAVSHKRHIFDHNTVIWLFTFFIQYTVGFHHVVHHIALGDLTEKKEERKNEKKCNKKMRKIVTKKIEKIEKWEKLKIEKIEKMRNIVIIIRIYELEYTWFISYAHQLEYCRISIYQRVLNKINSPL